MKQEMKLWDCAGKILDAVGKGVLLTTKAEGRVNTMTIGWGTLGIEWGKPIFTAFVRQSRYTRQMLEKNPCFTVNIPWDTDARRILKICGTRSGRELDKIRELDLHLEEPLTGNVPGIRELPMTLECRVIYRQDQDPAAIGPEQMERYYPAVDDNGTVDFHTALYGEVTGVYLITD